MKAFVEPDSDCCAEAQVLPVPAAIVIRDKKRVLSYLRAQLSKSGGEFRLSATEVVDFFTKRDDLVFVVFIPCIGSDDEELQALVSYMLSLLKKLKDEIPVSKMRGSPVIFFVPKTAGNRLFEMSSETECVGKFIRFLVSEQRWRRGTRLLQLETFLLPVAGIPDCILCWERRGVDYCHECGGGFLCRNCAFDLGLQSTVRSIERIDDEPSDRCQQNNFIKCPNCRSTRPIDMTDISWRLYAQIKVAPTHFSDEKQAAIEDVFEMNREFWKESACFYRENKDHCANYRCAKVFWDKAERKKAPKCLRCHKVAYCSGRCRRKDAKHHALSCQPKGGSKKRKKPVKFGLFDEEHEKRKQRQTECKRELAKNRQLLMEKLQVSEEELDKILASEKLPVSSSGQCCK